MKNLFLLCLFIPLFSFSQQYSEVVEIPDKTAENLYATAREWFALSFKSANDVLQMDDAVAGKLIGKGSTHVSESYITAGLVKVPIQIDWNVKFAISIFVKDGRYKYDITDILINVPGEILQVGSGTMTVPETEVPFENHLRQKEYYKNASDPDWLYANPVQGQNRITSYNVCYTKLLRSPVVAAVTEEIKNTLDAKIREVEQQIYF